jgi:hypothetical protein
MTAGRSFDIGEGIHASGGRNDGATGLSSKTLSQGHLGTLDQSYVCPLRRSVGPGGLRLDLYRGRTTRLGPTGEELLDGLGLEGAGDEVALAAVAMLAFEL